VRQEAQAIVLLLNPITPHASHALWQCWAMARRCWKTSRSRRPTRRAGARRAHPGGAGQRQAAWHHRGGRRCRARAGRALALAEPNAAKFMEGLTVRKIIIVPGKIVNIVAA
jgi:leucyl-tRNA synthetase